MGGRSVMYRVLVSAVLCLGLAGCGMASYSLTSGFANSGQPTPRTSRSDETGSIDRAVKRTAAKSEDKAPKGTFEVAPQGVLADRDYSSTRPMPRRRVTSSMPIAGPRACVRCSCNLPSPRRPAHIRATSPSGIAFHTSARMAPTPGIG
jgi:hypothetical protein